MGKGGKQPVEHGTGSGQQLIVVLDGGHVVQQGTWDELARNPGMFSRLLQFTEGEPKREEVAP